MKALLLYFYLVFVSAEPQFIDSAHVLIEQKSRLQIAGYKVNIWPAKSDFEVLREMLQNLDSCTVFQSELQQISCVSADDIVSVYVSTHGVVWSEAYLTEQERVSDSTWTTKREMISVYETNGYSVRTWVERDTINNLYQHKLRAAMNEKWQITISDSYAGSFALAKQNDTEIVSIAGWQQAEGMVFVTETRQYINGI